MLTKHEVIILQITFVVMFIAGFVIVTTGIWERI